MGLGGGEMTSVFTASQRQELERQTIIFKYMAASMPIPQELLIFLNSKYPSQLSLPPYQSNGKFIIKKKVHKKIESLSFSYADIFEIMSFGLI